MLTFKVGKTTKKDAIQYWHVYNGVTRIGYAYIAKSITREFGEVFTINVFVNRAYQRQGYGQQIFARIPKLSGQKTLYAFSSKSNVGSQRAALKAGFKEIENSDFRQRAMVWR